MTGKIIAAPPLRWKQRIGAKRKKLFCCVITKNVLLLSFWKKAWSKIRSVPLCHPQEGRKCLTMGNRQGQKMLFYILWSDCGRPKKCICRQSNDSRYFPPKKGHDAKGKYPDRLLMFHTTKTGKRWSFCFYLKLLLAIPSYQRVSLLVLCSYYPQ